MGKKKDKDIEAPDVSEEHEWLSFQTTRLAVQNRRYALDQAVKFHSASPVRTVTTFGASLRERTAHLVPIDAREVAKTARVFEQFLNNGDAVRDPDDGAEHGTPPLAY